MTTQNVDDVSIPLSKANGGTGVISSTTCVQVVQTTITPSVVTATTPFVATAALNTYGAQISTLSITPTFSNSILDCFVTLNVNSLPSVYAAALILYRDSSDGIAATCTGCPDASSGSVMTLRKRIVSGSTASTTFTLRLGTSTGITLTMNGYNSASIYNNVCVTQFIIKEYLAA